MCRTGFEHKPAANTQCLTPAPHFVTAMNGNTSSQLMTSLYKIVCMHKCCKEWGQLIWLTTPLGYIEDLQDTELLNSDLGIIYGVLHKSCRWWGPRLSAPMWNLFSFHIQLRKTYDLHITSQRYEHNQQQHSQSCQFYVQRTLQTR
jgi:hypothetical protein